MAEMDNFIRIFRNSLLSSVCGTAGKEHSFRMKDHVLVLSFQERGREKYIPVSVQSEIYVKQLFRKKAAIRLHKKTQHIWHF
jgi:hypothetical protein